MTARVKPTQEYLHECLREDNGRIYWQRRPRKHFKSDHDYAVWNTRWSGKEAGHPMKDTRGLYGTRWQIGLDGRNFYRYRIVWAMAHGEWPKCLDHQNRDTLDDRLGNLRIATSSQNRANQGKRRNNTSGYKGVSRCKGDEKWKAHICINKRRTHLGSFDTPEAAHRAYAEAALQYYGQFACIG